MDLITEKRIGCVAVMADDNEEEGLLQQQDDNNNKKLVPLPVGIITKSDIIKAYQNQVDTNEPCETIMHKGSLQTCSPNVDRDEAAHLLEKSHNHHLIVASEDEPKIFLGLVSSWDITAECARDHRAYPWIRSEDGKFHNPFPPQKKPSEQHFNKQTILHHEHEPDTVYMDDLDVLNFQ
jgi:CBS domain-containing protein